MIKISEAVLQATIKAYDEFTSQFQKLQQELRKTEQTSKQTAQGTDQMNKSVSSLFQTMGQLGALYAFKRGLQEVMSTGREFQLAIRQDQAVIGDMSNALRNAAMASNGLQGPTEVAKAYYELGSAGLKTNEAIKATPDILNFATAGLIKMDESAYAVSSTVKAFGLQWEETTDVVDAFTQAMNTTAMKAQDFQWVMSSVGAVGKMAGQDFQEVIAAAAAMRDAGVQAQDAGTSIKSALVALINPSDEARKVMKDLGIEVYDSSGKMKQWHEIVAEFERALGPYNDQSKNLILTTIAGSDGVRALATGLNMGSEKLGGYVVEMKNAEGATQKMANVMGDTFDGSIRKASASLEKAKIALFEDLAPGVTNLLNGITGLINGFNSMDEITRRLIEGLVGSAGLAIALTVIVGGVKRLSAELLILEARAGPIGWVIAALSLIVPMIIESSSASESAAKAQKELNDKYAEWKQLVETGITKENAKEKTKQIDEINALIAKYDDLIAKQEKIESQDPMAFEFNTDNYRALGDEIEDVEKKLLAMGFSIETAKGMQQELNRTAEVGRVLITADAEAAAKNAIETKKSTDAKLDLISKYQQLARGMTTQADLDAAGAEKRKALADVTKKLALYYPDLVVATDEHSGAVLFENKALAEQIPLLSSLSGASVSEARARIEQDKAKTEVVIAGTRQRIDALLKERQALLAVAYNDQSGGLYSKLPSIAKPYFRAAATGWLSNQIGVEQKLLKQAEEAANIYQNALEQLDGKGSSTGGGKTFSGGGGGASSAGATAAKQLTEAITDALAPYKAAVDSASDAVSMLGTKEQVLTQIMESGKGTMLQAVDLVKTRTERTAYLYDQQQKLNQQTDAEIQGLAVLKQQYQEATDPDDVKELQDKINELTRSISQAGQAWWQAEQQKLEMIEQAKEAELRRYTDAYQQSTDLMQHQVNMARMSTEQQIAYMEKLYDYMKRAGELTKQQQWEIEESLYRLRRQQLSDYMGAMEDEYSDALDNIESRTKQLKSQIQSQIDALDKQGETSDRVEAARKHNEKLAELQEQRKYHELRTGKEHQQAIANLDKDIAEEQRDWQLQQEDWARDDQKENLQKQLDQVEQEGEDERNALEEHYRKAKEIAENGILDTIAALAATKPEWMEVGKELINAMVEGMKNGNWSEAERLMANVRKNAPQSSVNPIEPSSGNGSGGNSGKVPDWVIGSGVYKNRNGRTYATARMLAGLFNQSISWDQATGQVDIGGKKFTPEWIDNGISYVGIAQVAQALGYRVQWDAANSEVEIYKAAAGGIFNKPALSMLAEAGESEVAMPLSRFQPMMNDAVLYAMTMHRGASSEAVDRAADRIIDAIETRMNLMVDKLINIEEYNQNDSTDVRVVSSEISGAVKAALRAKGD